MKTTGIVALSLLGLAVAAPHRHHQQAHKAKRDLVWVTETAEVVETVVQTTTVWVDPEDVPAATTTAEETPEYTPAPEPTTTEEAPATTEVPSSSSVYTPPAPTTTETPSSTYTPPPAPTTTEAPTSTYVPPAPETTSSSTSSAVVAAETASSDSSSSSSLSGDLGAEKDDTEATWYNTMGAYAACGTQHYDTESVVALKSTTFNQYKSEICDKAITLSYNGKTTTAKLVDSCPGCKGTWDIDLSPPVFEALTGDLGVGRIDGLKWWFD